MAEDGTTATVETSVMTTEPQAAADNPFNFPPTQEASTESTENVASKATNEGEQVNAPAISEKYEFHLPEGLSMTPEIESKFTEIAKNIGLTQEQADGLVKLHSDIMLETMKQAETQKNQWADECSKAGLATPEKMKTAKLAVDTFDDTGKVMGELIESGLAYSPNVQRFLQLIGSYLKEDTAPDSKPAAQAKSAADLLFSNSKYN